MINVPIRSLFAFVAILVFYYYEPLETQAELPAVESPSLQNQEEEGITELFIYGAPYESTLQQFAGSATVISSDKIVEEGASSFQDLLTNIPGLNYSAGSSRPRFFQIRGIGELEQYEGAPNPSVGLIVDDIDFSGSGVFPLLFDIDQVEVLRGPQSIRYGSSALAGVIALRSREAEIKQDGIVELGVGNDDLLSGSAAVGGAVDGTGERLLVRIATSHQQSDGFRDNLYLNRDDTNERAEHTTRVKAHLKASDDLRADLTLYRIDNDNGYDAFAIDNSLSTQSDKPGRDDTGTSAGAFKTTYQVESDITVQNIVAVARTNQNYSYDGDWGNNPFWEPYAPYDYFSETERDRNIVTEELRLNHIPLDYRHGDSISWVTGVFLSRHDEDATITDESESIPYRDLESDYRADTVALFADREVPLGAGTSLHFGGRIEHRSSEYRDSNHAQFTPEDTMYGGNISLNHDLVEDLRLYVTAARGFKGGGFNPGTTVPTELRQYEPESLWNFESGVKGSFLEDTLRTDLSVFYGVRNDAQLKFAYQNDPTDPLSFTYITDSAAEGWNAGMEGSAEYLITPSFSCDATGGLLKTEYTSVPIETTTLEGREFPHAPAWQYSVGTTYRWSENWFARIELSGKDRFYFDDSHDQQSNPYYLLGASAGYRSTGFSWIVWGRNLTDESYATRGFYFGNEPPDFVSTDYIQRGDPLAFGTTLIFGF